MNMENGYGRIAHGVRSEIHVKNIGRAITFHLMFEINLIRPLLKTLTYFMTQLQKSMSAKLHHSVDGSSAFVRGHAVFLTFKTIRFLGSFAPTCSKILHSTDNGLKIVTDR